MRNVKMLPEEYRLDWILQWIADTEARNGMTIYIDGSHQPFVDQYIEATGAWFRPNWRVITPIVVKCPRLGKDLHTLYKAGKLERFSRGVDNGTPHWTYVYRLRKEE